MKISIRKAFSFCTTGWSGGETTELFIYPQNSQFQDRDFIFRLSTATVEIERTQFTSLPGFTRKLMVLGGETILSHVNQHSKKLKPFDQDRFLGDWETNSEGKCTDFNLIISLPVKSNVVGLDLNRNQIFDYSVNGKCNWLFIYVFKGRVRCTIDSNGYNLKNGDLLVIQNPEILKIMFKGIENSAWVLTELTV